MIKFKIVLLLVVVFQLMSSCSSGKENEDILVSPKEEDEKPSEMLRSLREVVAEKYPDGNFFVGCSHPLRKNDNKSLEILNHEFGYITPGIAFKQSTFHPGPDDWDFGASNYWIESATTNGQALRMHGPISPQCSKWAKEDTRTPEELSTNLVEHMTALCETYDEYEHVKWMDVINEPLVGNGKWTPAKDGTSAYENPWVRIGYDDAPPLNPPLFIKQAFEVATLKAPNTKLIINEHIGPEDDAVWQKIKDIVGYLRERELRVDGIGWQAHISIGWEKQDDNIERLHALIDWAHDNALSFHITEMNVWMKDEIDLTAQAETFVAIAKVLMEHTDKGEVALSFWDVSDETAWKEEEGWEGCLFDRNYEAKPAYYGLLKLFEGNPGVSALTNGYCC